MAFKSFDKYIEDKNGQFFLLPNDKDYADVIFLYRNVQDVLVADTHYIKSPDYAGYVHCCGRGCPACAKGIRVQTKIFIPLYNYKTNRIEFWDRTTHFERQLQNDVLSRFPNPSEWVFRITRNGAAGSVDTTYSIAAQGKNSSYPYDAILASNQITLPEGYSAVCKDLTAAEITDMLNVSNTSAPAPEFNYVPSPRASTTNYQPVSTTIPEPVTIDPPAYGEGPAEYVPGMMPEQPVEPNSPVEPVPFVEDGPVVESDTPSDDLGDVNF